MRKLISTIGAIFVFCIVFYLSFSEHFRLPDYWTGLAILLTTIGFGILAWGFKPWFEIFFKDDKNIKMNFEQDSVEKVNINEERNFASVFNYSKITNDELDKFYKEAKNEAKKIYNDAALSKVAIQYFPFREKNECVYMSFFSKFADRLVCLTFSSLNKYKLSHSTPDKHAQYDNERKILQVLPWKVSPNWKAFLSQYYSKVAPITPVEKSSIHLYARHRFGEERYDWAAIFFDGYNGRTRSFYWTGKEINDENVSEH